ncbi:MAG: hypothetical protein R2681_10585 [Pyrinomonadaceae bacterium]
MTIFSGKAFSQKLERTEARASADFVESHAKLFPENGAEWVEIAGVYALFDGPGSPSTQTYGLGIFDEITDTELDEIEEFFKCRNAPVFHEVSPMADPSLIGLLNKRGYQPVELTSVLIRPLDVENELDLAVNPNIRTRIIREDEVELFAQTSTGGWSSEMPEFSDMMLQYSRVGAQSSGALPFIADLNDEAIATGTLYICGEVALLAGASTIPSGRRQGAQNALLSARLSYARDQGCKIAMMGALPGSQSQRNAEKNGFRTAYTRIKWKLVSPK